MDTTTKTSIEVQLQVIKIIEGFTQILESTQSHDLSLSATIKNVRLIDLLKVYEQMRDKQNVRLMCPGEFYNNANYMIIYSVANGVAIYIESEQTNTVKPKINLINYN